MSENRYEQFREIVLANLYGKLTDADLDLVARAIDLSVQRFDITDKQMGIIKTDGNPEVLKYYLTAKAISHLSMNTLKQYRYKLQHFLKTVNKAYSEITTNDIRIYLYNFKTSRNASDRYMESVRITINSFFQWLVGQGALPSNPCRNVDKIKYQEKRREPMTSYELEYFRSKTVDIREKALVDFFFSTGMRVSECAAVTLDDINWEHRSVVIRHGKGNKSRVVFFNSEAEVSLKEYLRTREDSNRGLFVSEKKPYQQIGPHALEKIIKKVSDRTAIKAFPHRLRHTFATFGLRNGLSLEQLQLLLGHESPKTTLIYAQQNNEDIGHEYSKVYT